MRAGEPHGITPYGTRRCTSFEAERLRSSAKTDGTTTPKDLGMEWIVSKPEGLHRPAVVPAGRHRPARPKAPRRPPAGRPGRTVARGRPARRPPLGRRAGADGRPVTSSYRSAALGRTFALAMVKRGRERIGETVHAPLGDRVVAARIVPRSSTTRRTCAVTAGAQRRSPLDGVRLPEGVRVAVPRPGRPARRPRRSGRPRRDRRGDQVRAPRRATP